MEVKGLLVHLIEYAASIYYSKVKAGLYLDSYWISTGVRSIRQQTVLYYESMKQITFTHLQEQPKVTPRNQKEDLIEQIVAQCNLPPGASRQLAKRLAIVVNTAHWTETDLHALLKKKQDGTIRNYTAFVKWNATIKNKQI